jgi:hypothetical protein
MMGLPLVPMVIDVSYRPTSLSLSMVVLVAVVQVGLLQAAIFSSLLVLS